MIREAVSLRCASFRPQEDVSIEDLFTSYAPLMTVAPNRHPIRSKNLSTHVGVHPIAKGAESMRTNEFGVLDNTSNTSSGPFPIWLSLTLGKAKTFVDNR